MRDTSIQILSYDRKRSLPLERERSYGFEGVNVEIFCIPAVPLAKSVLHFHFLWLNIFAKDVSIFIIHIVLWAKQVIIKRLTAFLSLSKSKRHSVVASVCDSRDFAI